MSTGPPQRRRPSLPIGLALPGGCIAPIMAGGLAALVPAACASYVGLVAALASLVGVANILIRDSNNEGDHPLLADIEGMHPLPK